MRAATKAPLSKRITRCSGHGMTRDKRAFAGYENWPSFLFGARKSCWQFRPCNRALIQRDDVLTTPCGLQEKNLTPEKEELEVVIPKRFSPK